HAFGDIEKCMHSRAYIYIYARNSYFWRHREMHAFVDIYIYIYMRVTLRDSRIYIYISPMHEFLTYIYISLQKYEFLAYIYIYLQSTSFSHIYIYISKSMSFSHIYIYISKSMSFLHIYI
ncbi:hypothetical protein BGX38DRAFT_1108279, partial [Terfezia claveryi]